MTPRQKWYIEKAMDFIVIFLLVFATASSGAVFKPGPWYEALEKPSWTPKDWVFPVVWGALYLMIAIAGWIVWRQVGLGMVLAVWGAQLVVNAAWSWLFFGMRRMDLAFVDVCGLWLLVFAFIGLSWSVSMWAALLFVPYLVWVSIAAFLNLRVWQMNRMSPLAAPDIRG